MVNKYLGTTGLRDLIELIKGDFAKKQDWLQFAIMPDAAIHTGQVIQYTGENTSDLTKGFFYYSTGFTWEHVETSSAVDTSGVLPDWADAKPGVIYYDNTTGSFYIKDVNNPGEWINLTQEAEAAFEMVDALPSWDSANEALIYFVRDDVNNTVTGYVKNETVPDQWYAFGGGGQQPVIQSALNFKGVATNVVALPALRYSTSGDMYIVQNDSTTDARFVEGPGQPVAAGSQVAVVNEGTIEDPVLKYARLGSMMSVENIVQHFDTVPGAPKVNDTFLYTGVDTFNYVRAIITSGNPAAMGLYERVGTNYVPTLDTSVVTGKTYYTAELEFGKGLIYQWNGTVWVDLTTRGSEDTGDNTEAIPDADIESCFNGVYK